MDISAVIGGPGEVVGSSAVVVALGAGVEATDDGGDRQEDVPVVARRHPEVVRHAAQVEVVAESHHRVVRRHGAQRRYAQPTCTRTGPRLTAAACMD